MKGSSEIDYVPALRFKLLTPIYDAVVGATTRERTFKPGGALHVADWGRAANGLMRALFLAVQCLDGFERTGDNVKGRLVTLFEQSGFRDVAEVRTFGTAIGTLALYRAKRAQEP